MSMEGYLEKSSNILSSLKKRLEKVVDRKEREKIRASDVRVLTNDSLTFERALLSMWYANKNNNMNWTKEQIMNRYQLVITEMRNRDMMVIAVGKIDRQ